LPDTQTQAAANGSPVSNEAAAASSLPSSSAPSAAAAAAAAAEGSDDEDEEYAKQLQQELQAAKCCQDILDIVNDEVSNFQVCFGGLSLWMYVSHATHLRISPLCT
jgi:hypothetical protein